MEEQKKSFFELLDPKSALIVGAAGGLLTLGTIGFIVLGYFNLKGKIDLSSATSKTPVAVQNDQPAAQQQQNNTPPPAAVPKTDKPKVELFVMSYCPYGLQMEKAYAPVFDLLRNKADLSIKFVNYAMHGQKEVEENTRQYCIQKEQPAKYQAYLKCFFAGDANGAAPDYKTCLSKAGVNVSSLNSCYSQTDKQYGITAKYNDRGSWLSGQFPQYPINDAENKQYGVQGSPTLVINGVESSAGRTPEAVKQAICNAFNVAPSECGQTLSTASFQPGFGLATGAAAPNGAAGCGT